MFNRIIRCAIADSDYVTAHRSGPRGVLTSFENDVSTVIYAEPAPLRAFARGLLTLAYEIDGGELADSRPKVGKAPESSVPTDAGQDVKVGDLVMITSADGYAPLGLVGRLAEIDDDGLPYHVKDDETNITWFAAEVRKVDEAAADAPDLVLPERRALLEEARRLLGPSTVDELLSVAHFLAGEQ